MDRITTFPIARVSYHSWESRRVRSSLIVIAPVQPRNRLFISQHPHFQPPFAFFTCLLKKKPQLARLSIEPNAAESSFLLAFQFNLQGREVTLVARPSSFIMFVMNISTLFSQIWKSAPPAPHLPPPFPSSPFWFDVPNHFQLWTPHERHQALAITGCRKKQATERTDAGGVGVKIESEGQGGNGD